MKLNDLDNGHIIETAEGNLYLVAKGANYFGFIREEGFFNASDLREDLTCVSEKLTVNKVYKIKTPAPFKNYMKGRNISLIWERKNENKLKQAKQLLSEYSGRPVKDIIIL